jgi:hypothetical protein
MYRISSSIVVSHLLAGALLHTHLFPAPAAAQPAAAAAPDEKPEAAPAAAVPGRPWAEGVSVEQQRQAMELYASGTEALKNLQFKEAEARYREALEHWEHPSIHYHLAIVLLNQDRTLDAYRSVLAALRYEGAALHEHERIQALQYKAMLQQRLAILAVKNTEPGSMVFVDGERVREGAGQGEHLVLAGEHQVVVRKPGHATWTDSLTLQPGAGLALRIQGRREMVAPWVPWTLVGAGAAIGGVGGILHWRAAADMDRFDRNIASMCPDEPCPDDAPETQLWLMHRARWEQRAAVATYAAASGVLVTGLILVWINPERSFRLEQRRIPWKPTIDPMVTSKGAGLSVNASF